MAFSSANSCSWLIRGVGGEGGGTAGWNVPQRWVEDLGTSSYMPLPEWVRTICHKVGHTIRKVSNNMRSMLEYIKTDNWWNMIISLHEVYHGSFASIRSGSKKKWHRDCSTWNSTRSWMPRSKRTLPGFWRSFTRPQTVDSLGATIFERWLVLLETEILLRLQVRRKIKFWGCSGGILPLSWI
jgi:hypothetical protein